MEVKDGVKHTEAGDVPSDWEVKPLGTLLVRGRLGGNYPNGAGSTSKPLIKMGNIGRGDMDMRQVAYIPEHVMPDPVHRLAEGDVLLNTRNTLDLVGKVAIWRGELPVAYYNSNLMRLEFDAREIASSAYASYAFNTPHAIARMRELATGTTSVAAVYTRDLMGFVLPVPHAAEQCAIASALQDADALIRALERLIAKKRDVKQATMQRLLTGEHRLPGFTGVWREVALRDLGSFSKGAGIRRDEVVSEGLPCIRYGEIYTRYDAWVASPASRISPATARTSQRVRPGDVLFAASGETAAEIGKAVAYVGHEEVYAGGDTVILTPTGQDSMFLGYLLNHPYVVAQKARGGQGDAVVHIGARQLGALELRIPERDEQRAIATVLADMDAELAALDRRLAKTRAVKQAMMQELLTGRTRLAPSDG